jgi:hypothetical protein
MDADVISVTMDIFYMITHVKNVVQIVKHVLIGFLAQFVLMAIM